MPISNLNIVICPGCGSQLAPDNRGCPDCGYENNEDGRLLAISEILERPSYPAQGAMRLNDVSPVFLKAIVAAALTEFSPWLHAAYDRPPQTPEAVAMLAKLDAALALGFVRAEIPGQPRPIYAAGHVVHQSTD